MADGAAGLGHGVRVFLGGMALAFLYTLLSLATDSTVGTVGSYMTLLEVIFFILSEEAC
jgi:hypothetical protein